MKKTYLYILLCSIIFLIIIVIAGRNNADKNDNITVDEISVMLSFTNYTKEEWYELLKGKVNTVLKCSDVEIILDLLGIEKYIENPFYEKKGKLKYSEFVKFYFDITKLLDTDNNIQTLYTRINSINKNELLCNDGEFSYKYSHVELQPEDNIMLKHINGEIIYVEIMSNQENANNENLNRDSIRVLLKNPDGGIAYNEIIISSPDEFIVNDLKEEKKCAANTEYKINADSFNNNIEIQPPNGGRLLFMCNNKSNSGYRGKIIIKKVDEGLIAINELPIEEYLYGVVPSEMPMSFGLEPLKAQAVCARTYAYSQLINSEYSQYGADVDDTVAYQVYNNSTENDLSVQAVNDTKNEILKYNNEIIQACYYSTSCGHTTDIEVWGKNSKEEFPYLLGRINNDSGSNVDLTDENIFVSFIKNKDFDSFDRDSKWFRWNARVEFDKVSNNINNVITEIINTHPEKVFVLNSNGEFVNSNIKEYGKIQSISVGKRNSGGCVCELIIKEDNLTMKIISEYYVRKIVGSVCHTICLNDGSNYNCNGVMPSGFFSLSEVKNDDKALSYDIFGGGYGHGIGMSQYGAKGMSLAGKNYKDILKFYYTGVEIVSKE